MLVHKPRKVPEPLYTNVLYIKAKSWMSQAYFLFKKVVVQSQTHNHIAHLYSCISCALFLAFIFRFLSFFGWCHIVNIYVHIFKCVSLPYYSFFFFPSCCLEPRCELRKKEWKKYTTSRHFDKAQNREKIERVNEESELTQAQRCVTWRFVVRQQHNVMLCCVYKYIILRVASRPGVLRTRNRKDSS